jgi:murein DD-endopeptidase MepM/ murein hydrolase activator NlpD
VRTSLGGTVTFAARLAGRGVVVVDHGGVRTTYEPVSASVRVGQRVGRGERIGSLQRTSSHCFPRACLHWGLRRGEVYLDPLTLVGAGPIRLLPLEAGPGAFGTLGVPFAAIPGAAPAVGTPPVTGFRPAGARAGRPGAADPW